MRIITVTMLSALVVPAVPALAQDETLPESMRIQQSVTQQNANDPNMRANSGAQPTTEAPGSAAGPVEQNRLDPAAPSSQRLQIDDGTSAAIRGNPDINTLHPGSSGTSYNTMLRGSPSTSGASTGTSGIGSSGTTGSGASSIGSGASSGSSGGAGGGSSGGGSR